MEARFLFTQFLAILGAVLYFLSYQCRDNRKLYAMQFSEGMSARNGGKLGWINKGQLAEPLEQALLKMKEGEVSNPINLGKDVYILKLEKVYVPGVDKAPSIDKEEIRQMLENKKMEEVAEKYIRDLRNKAIINRRA